MTPQSPLRLTGNDAAIMYVAKRGLESLGPDYHSRLKLAIAVGTGLKPEWVQFSDILRLTTELHDKLIVAGLLKNPTQEILSSLCLGEMLTKKDNRPSAGQALLQAVMNNFCNMRVARDGQRLVTWEDGLGEGFDEAASALAHQPQEEALPG